MFKSSGILNSGWVDMANVESDRYRKSTSDWCGNIHSSVDGKCCATSIQWSKQLYQGKSWTCSSPNQIGFVYSVWGTFGAPSSDNYDRDCWDRTERGQRGVFQKTRVRAHPNLLPHDDAAKTSPYPPDIIGLLSLNRCQGPDPSASFYATTWRLDLLSIEIHSHGRVWVHADELVFVAELVGAPWLTDDGISLVVSWRRPLSRNKLRCLKIATCLLGQDPSVDAQDRLCIPGSEPISL